MVSRLGTQDPLGAFLSGKRSARRYSVALQALLRGAHAEFPALAVDLSEGGVLLQLSESDIEKAGGTYRPGDYLGLVEQHFRDGFDIQFETAQVVAEAQLVRMAMRPGEEGSVYLGCCFRHPLTVNQLSRLGVTTGRRDGDSQSGAAMLERLPREADPRRPLSVLVFDEDAELAGPRCLGEVGASGDQAFSVLVDGGDVDALAEQFKGKTLQLHFMLRGRVAWTCAATLVASRYVDGHQGGAELGLLTDASPPRAVRRCFRKRS